MATRTPTAEKHQYRNRTQGWIGYVTIDRKGDEVSLAAEPGGRVFLTEEECELTARAHRQATDSPFADHHIVNYDDIGEVLEEWDGPLLEPVD